jgi:DNA mismatch repair ATPase MutL
MERPPPHIQRLPIALATQLWAGRTVATYASAASLLLHGSLAAGATSITLTAHPAALRLTCTDDAGGPRAAPHALAGVASVDVAWRAGGGRTVTLAAAAPASDAAALLPAAGPGTVVDVWELFCALPVRRRAATAAGPDALLEELRLRVVAAAFASPHVAFRLEAGAPPVDVVRTRATHGLERATVSALLGSVVGERMAAVVDGSGCADAAHAEEPPVRVAGFISTAALPCAAEAQVVSVDGVSLSPTSFLHKVVRDAWRRHMPLLLRRRAPGGRALPPVSSRRRPAFVLNVLCNRHCADVVFAGDDAADVRFHDPERAAACVDAVVAATLAKAAAAAPDLSGGGADADPACATRPLVPPRRSLPPPATAKRGRPAVDQPFRAAKRARPATAPTLDSDVESALLHLTVPTLTGVRPCTAPSPLAGSTAAGGVVRGGLSSRLEKGGTPLVRRPQCAAQVKAGFVASAPSWSNPCLASRGRHLPPAVGVPRTGRRAPARDSVLDLRQVRITRKDIPGLRVVGQADLKFIIVVDAERVLHAVDQHAASERVHYESLQRKVLDVGEGGGAGGVQTAPPDVRTFVTLTARQVATVDLHDGHLRRWGWELVRQGAAAGASRFEISLAPHIRETNVAVDKAEQLAEHLDALAGGTVSSAVPRPILDALASSACHMAVRFGDRLSRDQCVAMVRELATCDLPFNCAHGRPSIVPLVVL